MDGAEEFAVNSTAAAAASELALMLQVPNASSTDQPAEDGRLSETEVKDTLRLLRDEIIIKEFPELDPERCILRDMMINRIVEARLDEPKDFAEKIPLWLRERTDQRQLKFLERVCSIVERLQ